MHHVQRRHGGWSAGSFLLVLWSLSRAEMRKHQVVDEGYLRRLDCEDEKNWTSFRQLLVSKVEAGVQLGQDMQLQNLAESLLLHFDSTYGQRELAEDFLGNLVGEERRTPFNCFPGYQAACLMRVLRLAAEEASMDKQDGRRLETSNLIQSNAQYCAGLFGKDAALEFLSSTSWPVELLDLEVHLRSSTDLSVTKRHADLPPGIETFQQLRQLWPKPSLLGPGSVDPQGISVACGFCQQRAGIPRPIKVVSVDGGHCALWLEPAVTLRALFPDLVTTQLASYRKGDACSSLMGESSFQKLDVFMDQQYFSNNVLFRSADVLVGQWVGECSKLRVHYSKPVIAYLGFLLLNDPVVGKYHFWSEPLPHYWERFRQMQACDVHASKGSPLDGGPPCAIVFEEPQLAEAAYWQTGYRNPSLRPLALYVGVVHTPHQASKDVLVINRARLVRDTYFTAALNAMKHPSYPHNFVSQRKNMPYQDMATYRAAVMMPWDLNLVMFHDIYAMNLPLFLPDLAGLHRVAVAYFARFRMNSAHDGQPFSERLVSEWPTSLPSHPFSPFDLEYLEVRQYWLHFTEYLRAPAVEHFASLPDLLIQVADMDGRAVAQQMQHQNELCFRASQAFWRSVLGTFDLEAPDPAGGRSPGTEPEAQVLDFTHPWARQLCWHQGLSQEHCCSTANGAEGDPACFDTFWTFQRCCVASIPLPALDDGACGTSGPYGTVLESPLDGIPWVQVEPSQQEPFVFLWDEKCGGTAFMRWLRYAVWRLGKLDSSFMYTMPGHPVAVGTPFYLKSASPAQRANLEVVSGHFDWRTMHEGIDCQKRKKARCLILVREPVERFLSYYKMRSDFRFQKRLGRRPAYWSAAAWRFYLRSIERERLWYDGEETGIFCNRENMLCLDLEKTKGHPLVHRVRRDWAKERFVERFYFRFLGGPQNRLTWALDPEHGKARTAKWRLRRCVVAMTQEKPQASEEVIAHYFPWFRTLQKDPKQEARVYIGSSLLRSLPHFARRLIAKYNSKDMEVYYAARRQFRQQLQRIRAHTGQSGRKLQVANITDLEAEKMLNEVLSHTDTFRTHERFWGR